MTYYKPSNSPQLLAKHFPGNDDPHARLTHAESLARTGFHLFYDLEGDASGNVPLRLKLQAPAGGRFEAYQGHRSRPR